MTRDSTLPRRLLGRHLRQLRKDAKISQAAAAKAMDVGANTLWAWESGLNSQMKIGAVKNLCEMYGADAKITEILLDLTEQARQPNWWNIYADAIPDDFQVYVGLEQSARCLYSYQDRLLPGMVQTSAYRRAIIPANYPDLPADEVERRLELAAKRQARLDEPETFTMHALLDESALRRRVGEPGVMVEQLKHLVAVSKRPNVTIRVVPLTAGSHEGLVTGPFVLLEFPPQTPSWMSEPPLVYVETFTSDLYLGNEDQVRRYRDAYAVITRAALSEAKSRALILEIVKEIDQ
ncbi:helix-turn-helix domain-containing protein [Nocardia sp. NPDC057030]|uniref:helix-turn-helix domain-containing protein n=1 Tax=unclassified Nocardia TaxID=2637762 RepID=UPI0036418483